MPTIDTLIPDVKKLLEEGIDNDVHFHIELDNVVRHRLSKQNRERNRSLRMSNIGTACDRKLWYQISSDVEPEKLRASTYMKFLYGDILEELFMSLAKMAGHKVENEQKEIEINGIKGHMDGTIDGVLVDVKSASPYSYRKFTGHLNRENDAFGYLDQINSYLYYIRKNPTKFIGVDPDLCAFIAIDKVTGDIHLDKHPFNGKDYWEILDQKVDMLSREIPDRGFNPVPEGKSGNKKLDTYCSYCDFKKHCFNNLRTFLYSNGPVFLTEVRKTPKVPEVPNNQEEF